MTPTDELSEFTTYTRAPSGVTTTSPLPATIEAGRTTGGVSVSSMTRTLPSAPDTYTRRPSGVTATPSGDVPRVIGGRTGVPGPVDCTDTVPDSKFVT
jgi:hypothetical protein